MQLLDSLTAVPPPLEMDGDGIHRVHGTRVRLETILTAFHQGASPEEIILKFPSVELTDVYAIITYYLWHREQVDEYLNQREAQAETIRSENEVRFPPQGVRQRLLARRGTSP